jgi:hypothetical protein
VRCRSSARPSIPRTSRNMRPRCSSRRSCPGRARSRSEPANRSTTTRSRCGNCRSRSCQPIYRPRPFGATGPCRASAIAAS